MADEEGKVGEEEVQSFTEKLEAWGEGLNVGEKALLQIVLERAAGRSIESAGEADLAFPASKGFGGVVQPFLRELVAGGALNVRLPEEPMARPIRGWVRAGTPWIQGA